MDLNKIIELNKIDQKINSECKCGKKQHSIFIYRECLEYYQNKKKGIK